MAYIKNFQEEKENEKELAYDLRSFYAHFIGAHFRDIYDTRRANDFKGYFKALEDLHVVLRYRFPNEEEDEKKYQLLKLKAIKIFNEYRQVYLKLSNTSEGVAKVMYALNDIEMFLWEKAIDANLFGSKYVYDEDEI